nr:MAG TPA: hypothetical protein [Caudoviricetes sp.]
MCRKCDEKIFTELLLTTSNKARIVVINKEGNTR